MKVVVLDTELHVYDSRYDTRDEEILLRVGIKQKFENPKEPSHGAPLVLTSFYSSSKVLQPWRTSFEVGSPYLIKALREVVKVYPGVGFDATRKVILMPDSSRCLFHHQIDLEKYASSSKDTTLQSHMTLCMPYVGRSFRDEISSYNATVGDKIHGIENLVMLHSVEGSRSDKDDEHWRLMTRLIEADGTKVGYAYKRTAVSKYEGFAPFTTLFSYYDSIRKEKLSSVYDGKARLSGRRPPTTVDRHLTIAAVRQRIIVDFEECYQNLEGRTLDFSEAGVPAFILINNQWGWFNVDDIQPATFNDKCFENLILPSDKKKLISFLIMSRNLEGFSTDDFVAGKEKGVIILLHSPPGAGKTFTAGKF
ncbi:hypothetical protein BDP55DRAFT_724650 [Colletotrichum godetiae]|uniref:Uncharacterized protein n=1 Tax=Colletotrichum godetiae TaxID=1209918 RepID=A0AAJ0AY07_9PEZI|nr:uncharacterized protein BDP55DRAFT_724650 [Colletotrichum godetiae]KAK1691096.1 hypothetical protein BDP55DRAFT_724650 [Colletotrichum godetiae]